MTHALFPLAAHVFLLRGRQVLLIRRSGTGFADGQYCSVGGHLEGDESAMAAAVRECREEVGIELDPASLKPIGILHYRAPAGEGVDFFFAATRWVGDPRPCAECDEIRWFPVDALPGTTMPFVRRAVDWHLRGENWFDQEGWDLKPGN